MITHGPTIPSRVTGVRIGARAAEPLEPWPVTVTEPANAGTLTELAGGGAADATRALDQATEAFPDWAATVPAKRASALRAIAAALRTESVTEELAALTARETGKRLAEARAEVGLSAAFFTWFADAISSRHDQTWNAAPGLRHEVSQRPLGVVAVLTPWNFPLSIPARKIAPALAAGCTVLFKPSEVAPVSALRLAEIAEAHLPAGTLNTAVGDPHAIAKTWLDHPQVRGLTFTGSTHVGQSLAAQTAPELTRCVLELGGNAPFIVLDDADLDRAVGLLVTAKYRNNGQSCIAANQVWVPHRLVEPFTTAFAAATDELVLGDPLEDTTTLGPLALPTDDQRLTELVNEAETAGATVVRGTSPSPERGYFSQPAICVDPPAHSRVVTEEAFGPVTSIRGYDHVDEALDATRRSPHGLGGYVVGSDTIRASAVARALDAGIVGVNNASPNTPQVPFGGLKHSGLGYEGGQAGLDAFLTHQTIAVGPA